jgi:hypothetical protein
VPSDAVIKIAPPQQPPPPPLAPLFLSDVGAWRLQERKAAPLSSDAPMLDSSALLVLSDELRVAIAALEGVSECNSDASASLRPGADVTRERGVPAWGEKGGGCSSLPVLA